jgi:hypothetical protein
MMTDGLARRKPIRSVLCFPRPEPRPSAAALPDRAGSSHRVDDLRGVAWLVGSPDLELNPRPFCSSMSRSEQTQPVRVCSDFGGPFMSMSLCLWLACFASESRAPLRRSSHSTPRTNDLGPTPS